MDNLMTTYNRHYPLRCDKSNHIEHSRAQDDWLTELGRCCPSWWTVAWLSREAFFFSCYLLLLENSNMEGSVVCWSLEYLVF